MSKILTPEDEHKYTFILLHPMYYDSSYFNDFINYFKNNRNFKKLYKNIKFIFPEAPIMNIDYPRQKLYNIRSWYNYYTCNDGLNKIDAIDVYDYKNQSKRIVKIINNEGKKIKYKNIFLLGVSQGGTLIFDILNNLPNNIGGLFCIKSIYMDLYTNIKKKYNRTPIYIFSGKKDTIYKIDLQKKSFRKLKNKDFKISWCIDARSDHFSVNTYEHYFVIQNLIQNLINNI